MEPYAFDDGARQPDDAALIEVLGRSKKLWDELIREIGEQYEPVTQEWGFYKAWSLRLKRKKRTILYMIPCPKHFLCAFVFGGKATEEARQADLPQAVLKAIDEAPVYAEGRGLRLEVRTRQDLDTMKKLAVIKMAG